MSSGYLKAQYKSVIHKYNITGKKKEKKDKYEKVEYSFLLGRGNQSKDYRRQLSGRKLDHKKQH
jgi:hypothetical protein